MLSSVLSVIFQQALDIGSTCAKGFQFIENGFRRFRLHEQSVGGKGINFYVASGYQGCRAIGSLKEVLFAGDIAGSDLFNENSGRFFILDAALIPAIRP